jgi:hypothetical protein
MSPALISAASLPNWQETGPGRLIAEQVGDPVF